MGLFDEQIRQRMQSDQDILEDSFFRMASVVMDRWSTEHLEDKLVIARESLEQIQKYYHQKPVEIPDDIADVSDQLAYVIRPLGLMTRDVRLEDGWQNNAWGPMLGLMKDTGATVALLPGKLFGYFYTDPATGKKTRVTRKTAKLFSKDAICFYKPLPMKKLKVRDLLLYMKGCISPGDITLIVVASLMVTLVGMVEPRIYSLITGPVLENRLMHLMIGLAVFLVSAALANLMVGMVRTLLMDRINTKISASVEASVMMRILSLPVSFFRHFASGDLASRAGSVTNLCTIIVNNVISTGLTSLMSLLYVAQIFTFAPALVLPSLAVIFSTLIVSLLATLMQIRISREQMKLEAEESGMSYAMLNGVQKIKLSGSEKRMFARWARLYAREARLEYNPPTFLKVNSVLVTAIGLIGNVVLYFIAIQSKVSVSDYYGFNAAFGQVSAAFSALAGIAVSVATARPILEMAEPILNAEPEVAADKETVTTVSGAIDINQVSFRYEDDTPWVLQDLDLSIKAGEYVAIVGRTGCGKSTLVRLLLGFETPATGSIFYDHHDLSRVDPRSLRRHIGVVIQNGQLFQGDIYSNIVISAPHLTLDEAWEAAEMAGIADDIREMPMGMHTIISEGQGGVSGGQKQRLMIARAVAPKPRILIFDEATSALDNKTQKQVSDALDQLKCTRLVIAHRLSTIRNCDRILVMDKGAIVEQGTYDELIAKNGMFADLVARQRLDT